MAHHDTTPCRNGNRLPKTRAELLVLHEAARRRRNAAGLGGEAWAEASLDVARIEVEIAGLERAMDPPAG